MKCSKKSFGPACVSLNGILMILLNMCRNCPDKPPRDEGADGGGMTWHTYNVCIHFMYRHSRWLAGDDQFPPTLRVIYKSDQ